MYYNIAVNILLLFSLPTLVFGYIRDFNIGCSKLNESNNKDASMPIYGNRVKSLDVKDIVELHNILRELIKCTSTYFDAYNSVENLLSLYMAWENSTKPQMGDPAKNFGSFFEQYSPPFFFDNQKLSSTVQEPINLITSIAFHMKKNSFLSLISKNIFFAAVQQDKTIRQHELDNIDFESYIKSEAGRYIDRIIVAVNISLAGRPGVILLDPLRLLPSPIVIMKDGVVPKLYNTENISARKIQCPPETKVSLYSNPAMSSFKQNSASTSTNLVSNEENKNVGSYLKNNANFITFKLTPLRSQNNEWVYIENFIIIGKPFCSYKDIPEKRNLLERDRYLLLSDSQGEPRGGLTFSVLPSTHVQENPNVTSSTKKFKIFIKNEETNEVTKFQILYSKINANKKLDECLNAEEMDVVNQLNEIFHYPEGKLEKIIKSIAAMMSNQEFVNGLYEYSKLVTKQKSLALPYAENKPTLAEKSIDAIKKLFFCKH